MLKKVDIKLLLIMIVTIISRILFLGTYPGGVHADEAFAGYEAFAMWKYGTDSWGYSNPVYLTTWGSGMSALESYLMIPFIAIGGLNAITMRIPQALLGVITIPLFFLFLKKITLQKEIAYWGSFLLAISPWHIMMSRYAMDCNLAPVFILLGVLFAVYGLENEKYLLLSAVFWGLSLYAYAVNWLFVPIFLCLCFAYCMKYKKIRITKWTISAAIILFVFALPLLLFVAVNLNMIPEIKTDIISIPKLIVYRGNEVNLKNFPQNFIKLVKLFITQNDYLIWNSIKGFGIYYLFSTPFIVYGLLISIKRCIKNMKTKQFGYEMIVVVWFGVGVFVGLIQGVGINRINCIHLSSFVLLAIGIYATCEWLSNRMKKYINIYVYILAMIYTISFLAFEGYYFTVYQDSISARQFAGADKAIEYALEILEEQEGETIYVKGGLRHSQVLFFMDFPLDEYISSVKWHISEEIGRVSTDSFGSFSWTQVEPTSSREAIYIILREDIEQYEELGYQVMEFETCAVAY